MKAKKPSSKTKPKLSFSVDRDEFEISSDWVQAVMAQPSLPRQDPFFSPDINNATGTLFSTGEPVATEAINPPVENDATDVSSAPVGGKIGQVATGSNNATVEPNIKGGIERPAVDSGKGPQSDNNSTVENNSSARIWKTKPIRRITDGLTPGQFAVYTLMWSNGEVEQGGERMYRGGYADLGRLTGLSKRGIQNIIADLQEKIVIQLHTAPGHHRSQTSVYLVPDAEAVLQKWFGHGWRFSVGKNKRLVNGATVAECVSQEAT